MIKTFYKKNRVLIILLFIVCGFMIFMLNYQHAKPSKEETVFIFISDQRYLKDDIKDELGEIGKEFGIKKVNSFGYNQHDTSFSQAFVTKGYYSTDLFILSKDVIEEYKDSGTFKELSDEIEGLSDVTLTNSSGDIIAIAINKDYYVLVGSKRDKPDDLMMAMIKYLVLNGDDLFE